MLLPDSEPTLRYSVVTIWCHLPPCCWSLSSIGCLQVVVEYGSTWCAHCQEMFPHFQKLAAEVFPSWRSYLVCLASRLCAATTSLLQWHQWSSSSVPWSLSICLCSNWLLPVAYSGLSMVCLCTCACIVIQDCMHDLKTCPSYSFSLLTESVCIVFAVPTAQIPTGTD